MQVNAAVVNAETALANVKVALNKAVNEAEGFSDLIRASYSCESAQTDSLLQVRTRRCSGAALHGCLNSARSPGSRWRLGLVFKQQAWATVVQNLATDAGCSCYMQISTGG